MADRLTDTPTKHWTGVSQDLIGIVRVDQKNYRFLGSLGREDLSVPALVESSSQVTPTRTVVVMTSPEIELRVEFLTPAFPEDMKIMARPVTYLTWDVKSHDGHAHDVRLLHRLYVQESFVYSDPRSPLILRRYFEVRNESSWRDSGGYAEDQRPILLNGNRLARYECS